MCSENDEPETPSRATCLLFITSLLLFITTVTLLLFYCHGADAVCVFNTAVPITKLFAWGEGDSGGHVLRGAKGAQPLITHTPWEQGGRPCYGTGRGMRATYIQDQQPLLKRHKY